MLQGNHGCCLISFSKTPVMNFCCSLQIPFSWDPDNSWEIPSGCTLLGGHAPPQWKPKKRSGIGTELRLGHEHGASDVKAQGPLLCWLSPACTGLLPLDLVSLALPLLYICFLGLAFQLSVDSVGSQYPSNEFPCVLRKDRVSFCCLQPITLTGVSL